jgi:pilus assembly protein CpaE
MSQPSWKPVKLNDGSSGGNKGGSSHQYLVDLVIYNPVVKDTLQGIVNAHPNLKVKDPNDSAAAQLVILELDEDPSESFSFIETVVQAVEGREVFLTSPRTDSQVLLEALRAGAKEFFPQPIQESEVKVALDKFSTRYQQVTKEHTKKVGKILCLLGGKGGIGTTTVAVNLGLSLQGASSGKSVVLVELNQHGGDLSIFLDVQSTHSLRDLGSDLTRLDLALMTRVLSKHSSGIHILPSGYDDLSSGRISPESVEPILKLLQSLFDHVVVDCGHVLDLPTKKALEMASSIMVISTLIVPVIHRTKKLLDLLRNSGIDGKKVRVVFNRYSSEEQEVLRETEEALKIDSSFVIPNDYVTASDAINNGTPMVLSSPRAAVTKVFHDVVIALGYVKHDPKEQGNWMGRLRGMMNGRGASKVTQVS